MLVLRIESVLSERVRTVETKGKKEPQQLSPALAKALVDIGVSNLQADYSLAHTQLERLLGVLQVDGVLLAGLAVGLITLSGDHRLSPQGLIVLVGAALLLLLSIIICVYGMRAGNYGAIPSPGKRDTATGKREVDEDLECSREAQTYVALIQALHHASLNNIAQLASRRTTVLLAIAFLLLGTLAATSAGIFSSASTPVSTVSPSPMSSPSPQCSPGSAGVAPGCNPAKGGP
jgi:hypothetical protein